ncbi:MAG TPA: carboxyl transferase domain-containing protein [Noviherbaspirillum sp.]|jgi:acetyl/propionyl-CoA carboxylase alpha subunit|uniref:acetyl-CoA carboxylase family protein n=1 Tax=Noviherbaspirillum sp. TaxID=1926288 RepID=UPI002DDD2F32|nr:carboxyl transferase domain-containing protein [Noviherbaspirillum sp.]HEV2610187.1 carboxyl transferase domain-containing protein [Noviherbaspirillum sp.]
MTITTLLIANRGEIAIRIARAAAELGIRTVAIYSEDDAASLHLRKADSARPLHGKGAAAYLDMDQILAAARDAGCDAVHPGYGFLSENAEFARRCAAQDLLFVGPLPETLELFGDKAQARKLAQHYRVPVVHGTEGAISVEQAKAFLASLGNGGAMMIKALAGGGGRGMRAVSRMQDVDEAYTRCRSEAVASFGSGELYAEQLVLRARHIEVQVIGDGSGRVSHFGERECTLQRRNQKLVEIAPSPSLSPALRGRITDAAKRMAEAVNYSSLGTFEFLVDEHGEQFMFIEANPRLQVEHTVTEEVTGVDLVKAQLQLAGGATLGQLGLDQGDIPAPRGHAIQLRINMETMRADGDAQPSGGTLAAFEPPSGAGIRADTFGYAGYTTSPSFDSLLAKLIVHSTSASYADAAAKAYRALCEFRIDGVPTNIGFLQNILRHPDVILNRVHTRFVEERIADLLAAAEPHRKLYIDPPDGAREAEADNKPDAPDDTIAVPAPMQGSVVSIDVREGDMVHTGQQVAVIEAMKMEHIVKAQTSGVVRQVAVNRGDVLFHGAPLLYLEASDATGQHAVAEASVDLDHIRADLAEVRERHAIGLDENRPDAVARRRKTGQRTARENIDDLCDDDSFIEYGALAIAAQRLRRPLDELIRISPADGLVAGVGAVNGALFEDAKARCMVMSYDYTVFAGTQGMMNHKKTDRMFQIAEQQQLPVVIFAEGGGGRPGDTDAMLVAGLDVMSFINFARLSGLVPRVGVVSGRCFAGNAAFLGCCDVIIATENATIGMGGPAMIEGGGLGVFLPEQVGPVSMQAPNGVIDVVVPDEAEAVRVTKQYLSYFQGPISHWECADQRELRHLIPENRLRSYDIRGVIETLADKGSVLELRRQFGIGIITALVRIEGRPFGLIANNPMHLGGAIDADAADKAARFMQLCDAFDLPMLSLCDTPGFMVGPDAEKTAMVRHVSRMFVTAGSLSVPFFTIVLRKGYGLGAQAMAGGSFHAPFFTIAWPSGEFGAMGLEGAVRLGYRKELEAIADPAERKAAFEKMVAESYEKGKAINMASFLEIDDVIDPMDSRRWVMRGLRSAPPPVPRNGKKRPFVDTW